MTWATIITTIMSVFGPFLADLLKKLLDKWLNKTPPTGDPSTMAPEAAVGAVFDSAEANLPRVAPARKLLLRMVKRISLKHSAAIVKGEAVTLDQADIDELNLANKFVK